MIKCFILLEMQTVGTKAQVYHGTAKHTSGGLIKKRPYENSSWSYHKSQEACCWLKSN